ncbi:fibronectin type III domain-containing protein [Patescibacteria group bacterium]|nr:fibronectin type III domain-containing protein [Patescibacteria group bacterium]MBU4481716.1 fibronectin type III domain-containing protein [Patescibacteria group bacterium]
MGKKIKRFFSNDRKVSKLIFNLLIIGVVVLIAGSGVFAYFKREAADNQFSYGYGYGYGDGTYGYGYGYGYGANISGNEDYGFWGADGKATDVAVTAKTENSLTIGYTTSYTAKNRIEYGTSSSAMNSTTSWSSWQTGTNTITVSGLTASTIYYYKVATQDAGENVWYSTATTATTTATGAVTVTSSVVGSTTTVSVGSYSGTVTNMFTSLGVTSSSFSQAFLATAISSTVSVTGLTGAVSMDIPAGTTIYAATGTFSSIPAPSVDTNYTSASSLTVSGSSYNPIGKVVEFGISGVSLIFDKIVTVTIPDVTETPAKVIYSVNGTIWTEISQCNASDITSTATSSLTFPGACFGYNASTDIITLKTYHFTKFAGVKVVTTTTTTTTTGGGGGYTATVQAPQISGITVTVGDAFATISWKTDKSSLTWLVYGTSTAYGSEIKTTTSTASHSLTLTGLSPSTAYHYQIKSKDSAGNVGTYTDKTFTTLALGEQPRVVEWPTVTTKPISEMTTAELRAEIIRITALISQLQALLGKPVIEGIPDGFTFAKNLKAGMSNSDVVYLKKILDVEVPDHAKWTGTKYFGSKAKAAVVKFQKKYSADISAVAGYTIKASGFVGTGTRAKLNQLLGK